MRDPRKGYVRDFSEYEVEGETFGQQVVLPDCPTPISALAHRWRGGHAAGARAGKRVSTDGAVGADDDSGEQDRVLDSGAVIR